MWKIFACFQTVAGYCNGISLKLGRALERTLETKSAAGVPGLTGWLSARGNSNDSKCPRYVSGFIVPL